MKIAYGGTPGTRFYALTLKFEQYVIDPKHTMAKHLRTMSALIHDVKSTGNNLDDEQHVTVVIRSLLEPLKLLLIYLVIELEVKRLQAHCATLLVA